MPGLAKVKLQILGQDGIVFIVIAGIVHRFLLVESHLIRDVDVTDERQSISTILENTHNKHQCQWSRSSSYHRTMHTLPDFSLLALGSLRGGGSVSTTLADSVAYAHHAETLGFNRFWLAVHPYIAGMSSSATSGLGGHIAGQTNTVRVGPGGGMVPNHPPL